MCSQFSLSEQQVQVLRSHGLRSALQPGLKLYVVGDIHGSLELLDRLLDDVVKDMDTKSVARAITIFLGDYIDRGPSSRQTIDRLIQYAKDHETVFLKGNHEALALKCLRDPALFDQWMRLGGATTLASYGLPAAVIRGGGPVAEIQAAFHQALPKEHFAFFRDLRLSFTCDDYFFAHAGAKPGIALVDQKQADLLWIRDEFLASRADFGKVVVHGHTPASAVEVGPNRINIDTGAFTTGRLTCLVLQEADISIIDTLPFLPPAV